MIGCSGGSGHNMAITAIADVQGPSVFLGENLPIEPDSRGCSTIRRKMELALAAMSLPIAGVGLQTALSYTPFPVLPKLDAVRAEVAKLAPKPHSRRKYIDMLLDIYPSGYESAAIWNILQSQDKVSELKKLIKLQPQSDAENYEIVKTYFVTKLQESYSAGTPYTEIISTQAMGLPALCDAVIEYNAWMNQQDSPAPLIHIKQYMTDLATEGAVHFFQPLSRLSPLQQANMELYGITLDSDSISCNFPSGQHFRKTEAITPCANPMVRAGFKDSELDRSKQFDQAVTLHIATENGSGETHVIEQNERIASIMLGSQAGKDTYEYIDSLLQTGCQKVFVFCGNGQSPLREKIENLKKKNREYPDRIVSLDSQSDKEIAPLMSRSNVVITRGGGLSVMEQMTMKHAKEQTVLIHHPNSNCKILTSGISWEDHNATTLVAHLQEQGVHSKKTSPNRALRDLLEAQCISLLKQQKTTHQDLSIWIQYVEWLSQEKLYGFLGTLSVQNDNVWDQIRIACEREDIEWWDPELNMEYDAIKFAKTFKDIYEGPVSFVSFTLNSSNSPVLAGENFNIEIFDEEWVGGAMAPPLICFSHVHEEKKEPFQQASAPLRGLD
jgi:effector protein SdbA